MEYREGVNEGVNNEEDTQEWEIDMVITLVTKEKEEEKSNVWNN